MRRRHAPGPGRPGQREPLCGTPNWRHITEGVPTCLRCIRLIAVRAVRGEPAMRYWQHMSGCDDCLDHNGLPFHEPEPVLDGNDESEYCGICGHGVMLQATPELLSPWTPGESDLIWAHDEGQHAEEAEPGCARCDDLMRS